MIARAFKKLPGLVSKKHYRSFWISWDPEDTISFGKKGQTKPLLSYKHNFRPALKNISFASKFDNAEWRLGCMDDILEDAKL